MVEIEQEELERLKGIEAKYGELESQHNDLKAKHDTLKDDYIAVCKGQRQPANNKDEFDEYCNVKFGKKK